MHKYYTNEYIESDYRLITMSSNRKAMLLVIYVYLKTYLCIEFTNTYGGYIGTSKEICNHHYRYTDIVL